MVDNEFFVEPREQPNSKPRIVEKYLWAWANVVIPTARDMGNRILYIDLFAGPGRYDDGTLSTPLLVLQKAIADSNMRNMLVTFFNDRDADSAGKLRAAIHAPNGVEKLKYKPKVSSEIVGTEIEKKLAGINLVPTFFFVD